MRLPFALAALDWIASRDVQGARIALDLDGRHGWTCPAAGGYCVATAVPIPGQPSSEDQTLPTSLVAAATFHAMGTTDMELTRWLTRISLALAGQSELRDDSLCMASDGVWWVHRFNADLPAAQVEAQLRRQLLACEMLTSQRARLPDAPTANAASPTPDGVRVTANRFDAVAASAASAARRLHALRRG